MFGTLGGPELFLIFVVALIVFGPRKLPEIGKSLGKMMAEFRKASNEFRSTIESEVEAEKIRDSMRIEAPRLEPTASTPATSSPAAADVPPAEAASGRGPEPATGDAALADGAPEPTPETVSRQTDPAAVEPK